MVRVKCGAINNQKPHPESRIEQRTTNTFSNNKRLIEFLFLNSVRHSGTPLFLFGASSSLPLLTITITYNTKVARRIDYYSSAMMISILKTVTALIFLTLTEAVNIKAIKLLKVMSDEGKQTKIPKKLKPVTNKSPKHGEKGMKATRGPIEPPMIVSKSPKQGTPGPKGMKSSRSPKGEYSKAPKATKLPMTKGPKEISTTPGPKNIPKEKMNKAAGIKGLKGTYPKDSYRHYDEFTHL